MSFNILEEVGNDVVHQWKILIPFENIWITIRNSIEYYIIILSLISFIFNFFSRLSIEQLIN